MKHVGVLGGGQLGMMLLESIFRLGGRASVYDPDPNAPASQHVKTSYAKSWTDLDELEKFFDASDVVTYEFENVESGRLIDLENKKPILPSVQVLLTTQDRIREKRFMKDNHLPHARFSEVEAGANVTAIVEEFGFPCIVKRARGGYDGKGQYRFDSKEEFHSETQKNEVWTHSVSWIIEEVVELAAEVSCIVARARTEEQQAFPVCENVHTNHILDLTILPATVPQSVQAKVQDIALKATQTMGVFGLLTTEFFLSKRSSPHGSAVECDGWYIYINEFAPRPHNSGHVTRNACRMSQFDALARILLDIPLAEPKVEPGYFCMGNLLGEVFIAQNDGDITGNLNLSCLGEHPNVIDVVLYGKKEARVGRKMGHFVTQADSAEKAVSSARAFRAGLMKSPKQANLQKR